MTAEPLQMIQKCITDLKEKLPPQYLKIMSIICAAFGFCVVRHLFWKIANRLRSYPPGPLGLPIFGCLFPFGLTPISFIVDIAHSYGPMAYVPLVASNNVFINDPVIMKELFRNRKNTTRPCLTIRRTNMFSASNGEEWWTRRKFLSQTAMTLSRSSFVLSNVRQSMDNVIPQIAGHIEKGELWDPSHVTQYVAINNAWSAIFDRVLSADDPFYIEYCQMMERSMVVFSAGILVDVLSNYSGFDLIPRLLFWRTHDEADRMLADWMKRNGFEVDEERQILKRVDGKRSCDDSGSKIMVYADFLIDQMERGQMKYDQIWADFQATLSGAIDTTSQSSKYGFLLLAKYPEIQEKIYDELVTVLQKNGLNEFDFSVLGELHVFRAFIHEMLRISVVAALGLPHYAEEDMVIGVEEKNIVIPKGSVLHPNIYYISRWMDWNDRNKPLKKENTAIHLEYWLDAESGEFRMNDNFMVFSVGKRDCVGRSLAMKSLYAMFALFIQRYKFVAPNNDPDAMEIKQRWSLVLCTEAMGINVQSR